MFGSLWLSCWLGGQTPPLILRSCCRRLQSYWWLLFFSRVLGGLILSARFLFGLVLLAFPHNCEEESCWCRRVCSSFLIFSCCPGEAWNRSVRWETGFSTILCSSVLLVRTVGLARKFEIICTLADLLEVIVRLIDCHEMDFSHRRVRQIHFR